MRGPEPSLCLQNMTHMREKKVDFKGLNLGQSSTKLRKQAILCKDLIMFLSIHKQLIKVQLNCTPYRKVDLARNYGRDNILSPGHPKLVKEDRCHHLMRLCQKLLRVAINCVFTLFTANPLFFFIPV